MKEEGFMELFDRDSVVFLTSDSPNVLRGNQITVATQLHPVGLESEVNGWVVT